MKKYASELIMATFFTIIAGLDLAFNTHDNLGLYLSLAAGFVSVVYLGVVILKIKQEKHK